MMTLILTTWLLSTPLVPAGPVPALPNDLFGLTPGETTRAAAVKRLGPAEHAWSTYVVPGTVEPFLSLATPSRLADLSRRAEAQGTKPVAVEVLEWRLDDDRQAQLVFVDARLWYVVVPMNATARKQAAELAAEVEALTGTPSTCDDATSLRVVRQEADLRVPVEYVIHPDEGAVRVHRRGRHIADVFFAPGTDPGLGAGHPDPFRTK